MRKISGRSLEILTRLAETKGYFTSYQLASHIKYMNYKAYPESMGLINYLRTLEKRGLVERIETSLKGRGGNATVISGYSGRQMLNEDGTVTYEGDTRVWEKRPHSLFGITKEGLDYLFNEYNLDYKPWYIQIDGFER